MPDLGCANTLPQIRRAVFSEIERGFKRKPCDNAAIQRIAPTPTPKNYRKNENRQEAVSWPRVLWTPHCPMEPGPAQVLS
jgi:hypothetical protein